MTEFIYDISQKLSKAGEVNLDPMPWVAGCMYGDQVKANMSEGGKLRIYTLQPVT